MKHHRNHWNRGGVWTRKTDLVEAHDSSTPLKNFSLRNVVKDESNNWEESVRVDSGSSWNLQAVDDTFSEENKKIFQWDDAGALEYLKKAEIKSQQGVTSVYEDYLNESKQFSASIDWDTRWLCTLPDCAEDLTSREEKRKNAKVGTTHRDPSDNSSAVILGLPEAQEDTGCSGNPSIHLPLDFVPLPTGWGEGDESQADTGLEGSPTQPVMVTTHGETQVKLSSQTCLHPVSKDNERSMAESGWPEQPNSYQHIIPSGWEDVEDDQPVHSSGWGNGDRDLRSDNQMHQSEMRLADRRSYGCHPRWSNPHVLAESPQINGKSHPGKPEDFHNKCYKHGYWRPKRESETNGYNFSGRKSMQRPGNRYPLFTESITMPDSFG